MNKTNNQTTLMKKSSIFLQLESNPEYGNIVKERCATTTNSAFYIITIHKY